MKFEELKEEEDTLAYHAVIKKVFDVVEEFRDTTGPCQVPAFLTVFIEEKFDRKTKKMMQSCYQEDCILTFLSQKELDLFLQGMWERVRPKLEALGVEIKTRVCVCKGKVLEQPKEPAEEEKK